jgi:2,3-dihydroxyphenylpropionate 1,2-dioxygenase
VNDAWDRWFLGALTSGDLSAVLDVGDAEMEEKAGNGAHELRAWIAAAGAWNGALRTVCYEAVPSWVTGMGCVVGQ